MNNVEKIQKVIDYQLDYEYDFFGFKTLERLYLTKSSSGKVIERPQAMFMRVALGIHYEDLESAF